MRGASQKRAREAPIIYTRQDGSPDEPVDTRMVEIRPHVFVSEDYARANGLSRYAPPREPKPKAERKSKPC